MPVRIERHPGLGVAGEPQRRQHRHGLVADRAHPIDDRIADTGVVQRALQVVDHGQPLRGHPGPFGRPLVGHLTDTPLADVVGLSDRPAQPVLQIGDHLAGLGLRRSVSDWLLHHRVDGYRVVVLCGHCLLPRGRPLTAG